MLLVSGIYHFSENYQMLIYGRYASLAIATIAGIIYFLLQGVNNKSKIVFLVVYSAACPYLLMYPGLIISCMLGDCI